MMRFKPFLTVMACMLMTATAGANPHRLDDSLSHTVPPNVQMQWLPLKSGQAFAGGMEAWVRVNIRIDDDDRIALLGAARGAAARLPLERCWTR